mgnify:CR=1 FL=1
MFFNNDIYNIIYGHATAPSKLKFFFAQSTRGNIEPLLIWDGGYLETLVNFYLVNCLILEIRRKNSRLDRIRAHHQLIQQQMMPWDEILNFYPILLDTCYTEYNLKLKKNKMGMFTLIDD